MTPEERFTKIENLLQNVAERQAHADSLQSETEVRVHRLETAMADSHRDIGILARASWDLVRASRELVRSNRAMRELLTQHSKRLDRREGPA